MYTFAQRELFLYRLLAANLNFHNLEIRSPTIDVLKKASEVYLETLEQAHISGIMDEVDIMSLLIDNGLWSQKDEKDFNEIIPKHIELWKEEIYNHFWKESEREKIRQYLIAAKNEYERLLTIRASYNYASCEGLSAYAKVQYIVCNSTYHKGQKYKWTKYSPYQAMIHYQENLISESIIRKLSHTQPWESIWIAAKRGNCKLFDKSAIELSQDQLRLISWSGMYDSIRESYEPPPDEILDDDDALDGWLIIQKRKRKQEQFEKQKETIVNSEKLKDADEIYLMAQNADEASKIDNMNTTYTKMIKKQRFNIIDKQGIVKEQNLPDIKQDLMMEIAKKGKINGK